MTGGGVAPNASGNVFSFGRITPFARGGVVSRPTFFPMATGMGLMGEAGPEAVMPLRRLGNGRLGVESIGGGSNVQVNIINNHSTARITQREESDGRGGRRLQIQIEEMVAAATARPGSRVPRAFAAASGVTRS
jgi:phage-related minor tail protein